MHPSRYAVKHNPFVYFDDVTNTLSTTSAYCIAHVRPYTELATDLQTLTPRAGLQIPRDRMFLMDASTKTNQINAYVIGFGASKRVVIYDMTTGAFKRGWGGHGMPLSEITNDPLPKYKWTGGAPTEEKNLPGRPARCCSLAYELRSTRGLSHPLRSCGRWRDSSR